MEWSGVFVPRLPREIHLCRSSSNVAVLPSFLEMLQNPHILLTFGRVENPLRLPQNYASTSKSGANMCCLHATTAYTFWRSQLPKVLRGWRALYILTSKCASRHNDVHFLNIATSKSGPCFVHFDFEMCLRYNGVHLFDSSTSKSADAVVFLAFSLPHVLRATTACNFSSLIWPDGSAPAALASLLFDPSEPPIIGKTQCLATFLPFRAPASSFFWLFLFSDLLSSSLTLPTSAFPSVHTVGSLTSKLPSANS